MPRQPKLGQKNGYWHTRAGNPAGKYFGRTDTVPFHVARTEFRNYIGDVEKADTKVSRTHPDEGISIAVLFDRFLGWAQEKRSDRTYDERKRHLDRFASFRTTSGLVVGELIPSQIRVAHLQEFLDHAAKQYALEEFTKDKHAKSIKAAFNWGLKHPIGEPLLPLSCQPFKGMENYRRPVDTVIEENLPTSAEISAILKSADADLAIVVDKGHYRRRRQDEYRTGKENPYAGFADMITVYIGTGARTSELAVAKVKDYAATSSVIVLRQHKRAKTMTDPTARRIVLDDASKRIVDKLCKRKTTDQFIFTDPKGRPWTRHRLDERFAQVRDRAKVRSDITIYSFRHLWISEALMSGSDIATVARMADTSVAMIEKVYGHFRSEHLREAQAKLGHWRAARNKKSRAAAK